MTLKDITQEQAIEITKLVFGYPEWITSDFEFKYQPYIEEWYEDAREYVRVKFVGYFAGDNTAEYKVEINTNLDANIWYSYKDELNKILPTRNQNQIQNLFNQWGFKPYKI